MFPVKITRRASAQIIQAAKWWSENRPNAPTAFREDLARGIDLIAWQPTIGSAAANTRLKSVRRIHLSRIRYFLYYRVQSGRIEVLACWHSSRGKEPDL